MKRMFSGIKNTTPDLEDIFRDLAVSASEEAFNPSEDEYEEDIEELDKPILQQNLDDTDEEESDDEEELDGSSSIKQQQFDIDVTFQDEDVED